MTSPTTKSRLVVVVIAGLAAAYLLVLFVGLPYLRTKQVSALLGEPRGEVHEKLGPPTRSWSAAGFTCEPKFPCDGGTAGGPVDLYAQPYQAWYLYFDFSERLRGAEAVRLPEPDGGVRPRTPWSR